MAQIPWCLSCPSSPFSTIIFRQKKLFWVTVIATNVFHLDGVGLGESCRRCSAVAATLGWKKYDFDYTHIIKVNRIRLGKKKKRYSGCTEGAWMTSQLRNNFQASQSVRGGDDVSNS